MCLTSSTGEHLLREEKKMSEKCATKRGRQKERKVCDKVCDKERKVYDKEERGKRKVNK